MTTTIRETSQTTTAIVNPLLVATRDVFDMMLGCRPVRTGLSLRDDPTSLHELSAIIGVTGRIVGTIVLGVSKRAALGMVERMLGVEVPEIDAQVRDAVGEVTNMIAGAAKAQLEALELSIGIPNVVGGPGHVVYYPTGIRPICLSFDSEIGPFCIEAGFAPAE